MQSPEDKAQRVFGDRAAFYTTSPAHTDPQVLARVVELARPQPDWVGLDIATGSGHTAFALAPQVKSMIGVDITAEMLRDINNLANVVAVMCELPIHGLQYRQRLTSNPNRATHVRLGERA